LQKFTALLVEETEEKRFQSSITERELADLPAGEVLVNVQYSSLNYKDALSASGNKAVTRSYPHTPGVDAAGVVLESSNPDFVEGDKVIVTGYDLGMNTSGGFGQRIRVPANWVIKCPEGLSLKDAMILGTAGFTAALCIEKLLTNGVTPDKGTVLVTGATGGVGIVAVSLLHKLGFKVAASTGKSASHNLLRQVGADEIIDRNSLSDANSRPLLKEQWAGAIDVAGGDTLSNVIKSVCYGGSVACCGLVQSAALQGTVLPFILRGVNLLGVDSVQLPLQVKADIWNKLAGPWRLDDLNALCNEIDFSELESSLRKVLNGEAVGRYVLNLSKLS
jgi:acrylyl-CoA reductase (NADPH)